MDRFVLKVFLSEVERQCAFGLVSARDLETAFKSQEMERLWLSVHGFLAAVGNVSKLLWGSRPASAARSAELRAVLGVPDDSPLADRSFRNHLEHFDERLDSWARAGSPRVFIDSNVGPPTIVSGAGPHCYLRNLDPRTRALTFMGDTYPLKPVADALVALSSRAIEESARR